MSIDDEELERMGWMGGDMTWEIVIYLTGGKGGPHLRNTNLVYCKLEVCPVYMNWGKFRLPEIKDREMKKANKMWLLKINKGYK